MIKKMKLSPKKRNQVSVLVMKAGKMYLVNLAEWKKSTWIAYLTTILSRLTYKSLKKNFKIWHMMIVLCIARNICTQTILTPLTLKKVLK
jgi:hypothetical protein